MKATLILYLLILTTIYSCNSASCDCDSFEKKIKNGAEEYLLAIQEEPKSYEKISIRILDSVKKSKVIEENLKFSSDYSSYGELFGSPDSLKKILNNLKQNPRLDSIDHIIIDIKYKAKNRFGKLETRRAILNYNVEPLISGEHYEVTEELIMQKGLWKEHKNRLGVKYEWEE